MYHRRHTVMMTIFYSDYDIEYDYDYNYNYNYKYNYNYDDDYGSIEMGLVMVMMARDTEERLSLSTRK